MIYIIYMIQCTKCNSVRGGGYLTKFCTGRLRPEVQPLTLSYTILAEKVPLSHTYFRKSCSSFTSTTLRGVYTKNYN